jgi:hypothetical protein
MRIAKSLPLYFNPEVKILEICLVEATENLLLRKPASLWTVTALVMVLLTLAVLAISAVTAAA